MRAAHKTRQAARGLHSFRYFFLLLKEGKLAAQKHAKVFKLKSTSVSRVQLFGEGQKYKMGGQNISFLTGRQANENNFR